MKDHQRTIDRALTRIRGQQSPDGSFISLSGFSPDDFSDAIPRRTTFFTATILACLHTIRKQTPEIHNRAAEFLRKEKSERCSFNYWARHEYGQTNPPHPPYPDDLDDTFAALIALAGHDRKSIDARSLAAVARLLTASEIHAGGPYRTWLVPNNAPGAWQDIDLVVNSTIGYFLSLMEVHLPRLEYFINDAVNKNELASPYYPGIFHVGYFLSRFYESVSSNAKNGCADARMKLADIVIGRLYKTDGRTITTLEQSMAISSLIALGCAERDVAPAANLLVERIEHEGFRPYAFCIDPAREGRRCYAGASALTAAFSAEALTRRAAFRDAATPACAPPPDDHIHGLARTACRELSHDLQGMALAEIEKVSDEKITTLAYDFREVLSKSGIIIPLEITEQLSLANLYGWMAYTIYDDTLDGECDRALIPCANFFLRMLTELYLSLEPQIPGAKCLFLKTTNQIDAAAVWEQAHCRIDPEPGGLLPSPLPSFGDHQTLADRSIGHAMGPLAEMLFAGFTTDSEEYRNVECFFRHYLIVRQLHDDAHDWAEDLLHGRINSAGTIVMYKFQKKYPDRAEAKPIPVILPELKGVFWQEVINEVVGLILSHAAAARNFRKASAMLSDSDFMEHTLRKLESGAIRALKERNDALVFLKDYGSSRPPGVTPGKPLS